MLTQLLLSAKLQKATQWNPIISHLPPAPTDEERLLDAALASDRHAISTLMRRYRKVVLSIALSTTGCREDAEEIVQDTFAKAFRSLPSFRRDSSFRTWLCRIARRTSLNRLRLKNLPRISLDAPNSPAYFLPEKSDDALQILLRDERSRLLKAALKQLSEEDETALELFYFHEKSLEEICLVTGWLDGTAKSRLCRARKRLRKLLGPEFTAA